MAYLDLERSHDSCRFIFAGSGLTISERELPESYSALFLGVPGTEAEQIYDMLKGRTSVPFHPRYARLIEDAQRRSIPIVGVLPLLTDEGTRKLNNAYDDAKQQLDNLSPKEKVLLGLFRILVRHPLKSWNLNRETELHNFVRDLYAETGYYFLEQHPSVPFRDINQLMAHRIGNFRRAWGGYQEIKPILAMATSTGFFGTTEEFERILLPNSIYDAHFFRKDKLGEVYFVKYESDGGWSRGTYTDRYFSAQG